MFRRARRSRLRFTSWRNAIGRTPYSRARSRSSMARWPPDHMNQALDRTGGKVGGLRGRARRFDIAAGFSDCPLAGQPEISCVQCVRSSGSTGENASLHCDTIGQMPAAAESVRIDPGMDLASRMLWYLGWNPRPIYILSAAIAVLGAIAFRSPAGLMFGVLPMLARWKAAVLVNARAPSVIDLAKNAAVISGANRVGVQLENSDHTVLSTARSSSVPFGVR